MSHKDYVEILLVEDNAHDAELTMIALRENNLANNVVWLKDGQQALDFLFGVGDYAKRNPENKPRVILLDLKMPKIDGMEVLKKIRSHKLTKTIPVVILTSSKEERDIIKTYNLGVNSYIVKPVDFEQFTKCVGEIGYYWVLVNQSVS